MLQENKEEKAFSLLLQSFYSVTRYNSYVLYLIK